MVDELGQLEKHIAAEDARIELEMAKSQPARLRAAQIRSELESEFAARPADRVFTVAGKFWDCILSEKRLKRSISSLSSAFDRLGRERFLARCTMTLGALESELGKSDAAQFIAEERSGPRTITLAEKVARKRAA